ncbi:uncharacterized protein LOC130014948 [Mercurialis annua]|uniref:uncharacterized protein LOC130014948 n=1 Tax=Mercurialis annua TaxID=3986 RepID=UPI0024AEF868|nr:uncharacterized protein LOC130014948 [Mercurialis annua]
METDRSWMCRSHTNGLLTTGYKEHVKEFVRFALRHPACMSGVQIKCPCPKRGCRNTNYRDVDEVEFHLLKNGFVKDYQVWVFHGEGSVLNPPPLVQLPEQDFEFDYENEGPGEFSSAQRMILDATGSEITFPKEELPNDEAQKFYDMMRAAEEDIWPGNSRHSPFSASAKVMEIKCRHKDSVALVDDVCRLIQELLPEDNKMPTNFAKIKKLVRGLGLPVEVIDCCFYNCMIYWGEDAGLTHCKVLIMRGGNLLQSLYASKATARHMMWHADHEMDGDKMCHPSDSPAWKCFSELHSEFANEDEFMFLTVLVPGPRNPKQLMDIFLQPLIAELNQLWECGVQTYDVHKRQNFQLKAALIWTINDFPAYSMLSGWSTAGRKFLPPNHQFRRNVTDFRKGKRESKGFRGVRTGDELLAQIDRLGFKKAFEPGAKVTNALLPKDHGWDKKRLAKDPATERFPKAMYAFDRDSKQVLRELIQKIKFPDGYVSKLSRCVDLNGLKMHGMKSHDCDVFMQQLLPIALLELLPKNVWEPLTELSIFFRELTSTSLSQEDLNRMETEIPKILCKLECIFPPSFFDSMEHLPVHLPYEAMKAGPVQYRCMYLFERNETCDMDIDDDADRLGIFKPKGKPLRGSGKRYLEDDEIIAARTYVLLNCSEIEDHRKNMGRINLQMNSGICVRGTEYVEGENDFYGVLTNIIELEYPALPMKQTVIFKCKWFDPTDTGTYTTNRYNLVDVNHRRRYNKYEPFILAEQADQVHYLPYPSRRRDKVNRWAVCKIKTRSELDMPDAIIPTFQENIEENPLIFETDDNPINFDDLNEFLLLVFVTIVMNKLY